MDIVDFLRFGDQEPKLRFLVIGGWAVGAHGYGRTTRDVDFMALNNDRAEWIKRIEATGLNKMAEAASFAQFTQEHGDGFDLMFVNEETFEKLWAGSELREIRKCLIRVPSLDHLLALKLHVLKQGLSHRSLKDADDVETLIKINKIDLSEPRYHELFLKYGSKEIYDVIMRTIRY